MSESSTDLEGATTPPPPEARPASAGEFAALWNSMSPERRERTVRYINENSELAHRCFLMNHAGRLGEEDGR